MASKRWGSGARVDNIDTGKKMLLKAAITCFVSKGIRATTIEDVAAAANVTRRTVYRYYAGKNDLIAAVIDLERRRLFKKLTEACEPYQDDFPRMIEECIVCAAEILSPVSGNPDLITGGNAEEAMPHLTTEESDKAWFELFQASYDRYAASHPQIGTLKDIVDIVGRLVLSFRHVAGTPGRVRSGVRAFLSIDNPMA